MGEAGWGTITGTTTTLGLFLARFPATSNPSPPTENAPSQLSANIGVVLAIGLMVLAVAPCNIQVVVIDWRRILRRDRRAPVESHLPTVQHAFPIL
ncbi:hypothetical protein [[Eubacterium] cellulosolvens]